ncbi:hypothetical protein PUN28_013764 [Cardiocondyla obscurior]|uniref:Uncharacterized protein n=1 Tax=Cardiocondyla obscurior TaxID=286306 RepID=A0AAW2F5E2_9HYME
MHEIIQQSPTVVLTVSRRLLHPVSGPSDQMKQIVVLIGLCALGAGQILRVPSSYENGVKWEFGASVFHDDVLARSNVHQVPAAPTVYKKDLDVPIARREPVVPVYEKLPVLPDVYKSVVPTVYKKEFVSQDVHGEQPSVLKVHPAHSNIYKSEPIVPSVYKQHPVPIVHKTYPVVSGVQQLKSQPIQPVVYHQEPVLENLVPKNLPVGPQQKVMQHTLSYQNEPHHAFVHENVHVISHH